MSDAQTAQLLALSPILVSVLAGVAAMLADAFAGRLWAVRASAFGLLVAAGLSVWLSGTERILAADVMIANAGIAAVWSTIALTAALSVIGGSADLSRRPGGGGVSALVAIGTAASMMLASSLDILFSLIALETIAVCCYAIVVVARTPRAAEAGMKYVIQGAVATGLFLAGLAIHVGVTGGSTDLGTIGAGVPEFGMASTIATVFVISAYAFKLGAFPFHSWAPDVLETAPPAGGAFMASAPKIGAVLGLIIFSALTIENAAVKAVPTLNHTIIFGALAVGSVLLGNLVGLRQRSYLRMLGYSGVAQVGYAFVGLAAGSLTRDAATTLMQALMYLIAVYGIAAVAAFLLAQAVQRLRPAWDGSIEGMAGIGREHPVLGVATAIVMLSLTGIPLTAGFWGKLYVFTIAVGAGLEWLVLVALLGSVISFGYYGAVMRSMFFDEAPEEASPASGEPSGVGVESEPGTDRGATAVIAGIALALLLVGTVPLATGLDPVFRFFQLA